MRKIIVAVMMMFVLMIPAFAVTSYEPDTTLTCGSYTMYWYHGDENTDLELMVVSPTKATFYLNTRYGSLKMTKPKVNDKFAVTTAWQIKYNDGEFHSYKGLDVALTEANNILNVID